MTHVGPVVPPMHIDAEKEILGTLLVYYTPQAVHMVQAAGLLREDFYRVQHAIIYRAILQLHARGDHVDCTTVARFLETQFDQKNVSYLRHAGGMAMLELLGFYTAVSGLRERAAIVHEDGRWRRWLNALYEAQASVLVRDGEMFWRAVQSIRQDVLPGELRVVDGQKEDAA